MSYRAYLYGIAVVPAVGLWGEFVRIQKLYAIVGAAFIPMLALVLLVLNGRTKWVGTESRNRWWTSLLLVTTLVFFLLAGWYEIRSKLFG